MHTETHGGVPIGRVKTEKLRSNLTEIVTKLSSQAASRLSTPKKVPPPKVCPATPQAVSVTSKADATTPVSPTRTSTLEVLYPLLLGLVLPQNPGEAPLDSSLVQVCLNKRNTVLNAFFLWSNDQKMNATKTVQVCYYVHRSAPKHTMPNSTWNSLLQPRSK